VGGILLLNMASQIYNLLQANEEVPEIKSWGARRDDQDNIWENNFCVEKNIDYIQDLILNQIENIKLLPTSSKEKVMCNGIPGLYIVLKKGKSEDEKTMVYIRLLPKYWLEQHGDATPYERKAGSN
jgi:hypothetical protein